jgi:rsbT co-antagonist protein RsbR
VLEWEDIMNQLVYDFIKQNQDYILTEWMGIMKESTDERLIKVVSDRMFTQTSSEFIDMIITNVDSKNKEFTLKLSDFAEKVVQLGWPLTFVNEGLHKFTLIVINGMVEKGLVTPDNQVNLVNHLDKWSTPINNEIVNIYTQT